MACGSVVPGGSVPAPRQFQRHVAAWLTGGSGFQAWETALGCGLGTLARSWPGLFLPPSTEHRPRWGTGPA